MNILLVEDSPIQSLSTRVELERQGFKLHTTKGWQKVAECLEQQAVEAILLGLCFEDSSGLDIFSKIQAQAPGIPIVVFAVRNDPALALEFVKHGAQDYLVKGVASDDSVARCLQYAIERNRVDQARAKGEARLKAILDNSYDAFLSMDSKWQITDWNTQAAQTFGWSKDQILGKTFAFILPPHFRKQYMRDIEETFAGNANNLLNASRELVALHSNGTEFPIDIGIFRIKEDSDYMFCAFVRDITERQQSNEELERLVQERTERLTQSNEELRQFAKIASHDLQEPLRAVQGFAVLLAQSTKGKLDKDCTEFVDFILDGAQRMKQLIQSVLAHCQIEIDDSIDYVTDCNSVVTQVVADLRDSIKESGTSLEVDKLPKVAVERSQMVQLFQNLISNSIKYRRPESLLITITAERQLNEWLFSVTDNGIGIDPKYTDRIFDMFARLHSKAQFSGTGMGLAICKKIVALHGGKIWVDSKPGQGSIFLFTLPAIQKVRRKKMKDTIEILLVEDTPSDVRLTEEALKRSSLAYDMVVVNDGVEAMDYLHQLKESGKKFPDIILLDLNMPRKNGHEVLDEIKNDSALRQIPVVLLTVSEREEDVMEALKLKMNYYIAKPVTSEKLSTLLKSIDELHNRQKTEPATHSTEENFVRLILAGNPHTSAIALTRLANDPAEQVRRRVAEHRNIPAAVLVKLASDSAADVRIGVSENPNASASVLEMLTRDPCEDVRLGLANNPQLPLHLLKELSDDSNVFVCSAARATLESVGRKP